MDKNLFCEVKVTIKCESRRPGEMGSDQIVLKSRWTTMPHLKRFPPDVAETTERRTGGQLEHITRPANITAAYLLQPGLHI